MTQGPFDTKGFEAAITELPPSNVVPIADLPDTFEARLAQAMVERHGGELRFSIERKRWMLWDGCKWHLAAMEHYTFAYRICLEVVRRLRAREDNKETTGAGLASAKTVYAVVTYTSWIEGIAVRSDIWDADPWVLNTPGGIVDLKTGALGASDPGSYATKATSVTPDSTMPTPLFDAFLDRVTGKDKELQAYLWRMLGYCLTGSTREQALFFLYGLGANGKTVFLKTVAGILSNYHEASSADTFTRMKHHSHPTEIAKLRSSRCVTTAETKAGSVWDETRIKELTGGDEVQARFMRCDFFTFTPEFKLIIAGNNKPKISKVDEAITRRMNLIPFTVRIPRGERDERLEEKLRTEWPGILARMVKGCLEWQRVGLQTPSAVTEATQEYLLEQDTILQWIEDECELDKRITESLKTLFLSWEEWCVKARENEGTRKWFATCLNEKNFLTKRKTNTGAVFDGIGLRKKAWQEGEKD